MSNHLDISSDGAPIKAWVRGVELDERALGQLRNVAKLDVLHGHVAVMPDVHYGIGATVGTVIPTLGAIVPAAVGVDIGCGMCAVRTSLTANDLPDDLKPMRLAIERAVPHGRSEGRKGGGKRDKGAWHDVPKRVGNLWKQHLADGFDALTEKYPVFKNSNHVNHLGTLGTGNHFVELCLDEEEHLWVMLHSGSRGIGNRIATVFIEKAKADMENLLGSLPDHDLAYFREGTQHFDDYVEGVSWAQDFARVNRQVMLENTIEALRHVKGLPRFTTAESAVNCHHNYVQREHHFGADVWLTRKGAVRAGMGELGIIPGSMGAKSFIVRGKGNPDSFDSCSHGAGRRHSRTKAKQIFSLDDHIAATSHVECRKDSGVLDETPMAYKDIDAVMAAQDDLVEVVHTLRQVVCVKG
ncbi:MAG: RtcB family protein [Planctomycetaceae bacterium]|nr:RtcB family protein [Planctomycetaceae bacterium]